MALAMGNLGYADVLNQWDRPQDSSQQRGMLSRFTLCLSASSMSLQLCMPCVDGVEGPL